MTFALLTIEEEASGPEPKMRWLRPLASGKEAPAGRGSGRREILRTMRVEATAIPAVKIVTPKKFGDERGSVNFGLVPGALGSSAGCSSSPAQSGRGARGL